MEKEEILKEILAQLYNSLTINKDKTDLILHRCYINPIYLKDLLMKYDKERYNMVYLLEKEEAHYTK